MKNRIRFATRNNRTLEGIKAHLIDEGFSCKEGMATPARLECEFVHERRFPKLVWGWHSHFSLWSVVAEARESGPPALTVTFKHM